MSSIWLLTRDHWEEHADSPTWFATRDEAIETANALVSRLTWEYFPTGSLRNTPIWESSCFGNHWYRIEEVSHG